MAEVVEIDEDGNVSVTDDVFKRPKRKKDCYCADTHTGECKPKQSKTFNSGSKKFTKKPKRSIFEQISDMAELAIGAIEVMGAEDEPEEDED